MGKNWAKILVPALLLGLAAIQSFGIDAVRAVRFNHVITSSRADSLITDTTETDIATTDSLVIDSTHVNDTMGIVISARDTIVIPDSLKETDPFKFKYYIAIKDSTTRVQVRDSLIAAGDTLELMKLDSLYIKDSTEVAQIRFEQWYSSLDRRARKKYDAEQQLPILIARADSIMARKDSIRAYKDSVIQNTPRILETFAVPDSMQYKRLIQWHVDTDFQDIELQPFDTSYNYHFHEYPFFKTDLNAVYLGVIGSPEMSYNFFNRPEDDNTIFYTAYQAYSYNHQTLMQYNTKTPYTELCYWGTLFANQQKEESNIKILTTQNITPELNLTLEYKRFGSNGILRREDTDNRTAVIASNYLGKKYLMHAGFIYNKVERSENGGLIDNFWIRDTTVDAREIDVHLRQANNLVKKKTVYLDQSYRIPFTFINDIKDRRAEKKQEAMIRDSIMATGDSVAIAKYMKQAELKEQQKDSVKIKEIAADTLITDITTAFIGHSSEYTVTSKMYTDAISDDAGRKFFNDKFYLNPNQSADSMRVMKLENKVFMRLQPWSSEGIVSKIDVGIGDKLLNYYSFDPKDYVTGRNNVVLNTVYAYAGVNGQFKNYIQWKAKGHYSFLGYEANDFDIDADLSFSIYPFRRYKTSPITFKGHFETSLDEPDYYQQRIFTNHYKWENDFGKISKTKVEASVSIPRWKLDASVGYALLDNNIYYDTLGVVQQNTKPMSVLTATVSKNFKLWKFHFDHRAMAQFSSDENVLPLPKLSLNFRYYFQFDVVKKVMQMQIGANALYTSQWYMPGYNPVIGVFHSQNEFKYGNCPYIDAFVNIQWKRASIFVKLVNANMGWPNKSADYFSAHNYIAPQRALKFGISWPFYVQPGKDIHAGAGGARGSTGGGRQNADK